MILKGMHRCSAGRLIRPIRLKSAKIRQSFRQIEARAFLARIRLCEDRPEKL